MEYTRLGSTGPEGQPDRAGLHELRRAADAGCTSGPWTRMPPQPFFRQAVELGVTFWDTANVYQAGTSEEFVGRADQAVLPPRGHRARHQGLGKMHDGPGGSGLSRKAILEQVDASLRRLGTDYIDVYYIHRFDDEAPVEETMEALHDVVKAGKVRYLGCVVDVGVAVREDAARRRCCTAGRRSRRWRTSTTSSSGRRSGT